MTTKISRRLRAVLLLAPLTAFTATQLTAVEVKPFGPAAPVIDIHGFASQGYLLSSDYNYLGQSREGSLKFTELGLNASFNPFPRTRVSAQVFAFSVGNVGEYDPLLDYAMVEYTFADWLGVRAGRIRRPLGIYNHVQDVDLTRTWILLPQGVYDARYRDFYCTIDGGELFGDIGLGKAGDLAYEAYLGEVHLADNGGLARKITNSLPPGSTAAMGSNLMAGLQLWWNTPLTGWRLGAGGGYNFDLGGDLRIKTPFVFVTKPLAVDVPFLQFSVDGAWRAWTFQAEYYTFRLLRHGTGVDSTGDGWYVSAARRINKWVEAGAYYTESYDDTSIRGNPLRYQKDATLSLRFDASDHWIFKVEGHNIHGTGLLHDNASNPVQRDNGWWLLALKATYSF